MRGKKMIEAGRNGSKLANASLIVAILFIAVNLRPALATVGPLTGEIRNATGLSNSMLGLLTTLPLLAFGLISAFTSAVTRRLGIGITLLSAMFLLAVGIGLRSADSIFMLYFGTILLGIGIAFGNVLLPSITKQAFSKNSGSITGLYSGVMAVGASLAAGLSVPISVRLSLGWQETLGIWVILAIIAFLLWLPQLKRFPKTEENNRFFKSLSALAQKTLAWKIALFIGLQSLIFYSILAWLPEILQSRGADANYAGWMLSLSQGTGIMGSLLVPIWASRKQNQQGIVLVLFLLEAVAIVGLLSSQLTFVVLWVSMIGFALSGSFSLALLLMVLRTKDTATTTQLSGMSQSVGYLVAAIGPLIFGNLFDITHSWTYPIILLLAVAAIKFYCGWGAAKEGKL